jgi:hypothetical protein
MRKVATVYPSNFTGTNAKRLSLLDSSKPQNIAEILRPRRSREKAFIESRNLTHPEPSRDRADRGRRKER